MLPQDLVLKFARDKGWDKNLDYSWDDYYNQFNYAFDGSYQPITIGKILFDTDFPKFFFGEDEMNYYIPVLSLTPPEDRLAYLLKFIQNAKTEKIATGDTGTMDTDKN